MKEILKLVAVLALVGSGSGLLLSMTNSVTRERIELAAEKEALDSMKEVLPEFDNEPNLNTNSVREAGVEWVVFVARKDGRYAGTAFECQSKKGYGGVIRLIAGLNADDTVRAFKALEHHETPGLGTKAFAPEFKKSIVGRKAGETNWKVKKDGGDVDAVTGATISSRAVCGAIASGIEVFLKHREEIVKTGSGD